MDVKNFGFYSLGGNEKKTVTDVSNFGKDSLPENIFRNMVIHAPMLARTAYSVMQYVLDEGMRVKLSVDGSKCLPKMQEHIRDEWIPDVYGGQSKMFDETDGHLLERGVWTNGECIHPKDQLQYFLDHQGNFD